MFALQNGVMLGLWSKYTAEPRVDAPVGTLEICFPVDNVDALYEDWGKKHVTIAQKPTDMDFGRTFVVLDPDGHRIRIYRLKEENSCTGSLLQVENTSREVLLEVLVKSVMENQDL